ncbi:MAG: OmpH family outer membrane protein [Pseudomonadota bacterium]
MPRLASLRLLLVSFLLMVLPGAAWADTKIAIVDFDDAINRVDEGATAMAHFQGVQDEKTRSLAKREQELAAMQTEIRNQSSILSPEALSTKQEAFQRAVAEYQQAAMQAQQELEQGYMIMLDEFKTKLVAVVEQIGKERGYNLVVEKNEGAVIYSAGVDDITDELVRRYNAAHPAK